MLRLARLSSRPAALRRWLHVGEEWTLTPQGARLRTVSRGAQGDPPVVKGQAVRVEFVARLEDGKELAHAVRSFKLGHSSVCDVLDQGVVGMCVGDRRKMRAPPFSRRGPLLEQAPNDAVGASLSCAHAFVHPSTRATPALSSR